MRFLKIIIHIILIVILTIITQVGGIFYILALIFKPLVVKKIRFKNKRIVFLILFFALYFLGSFIFIPIIAKPFGRQALPVFSNKNLKPLNIMTCMLNRHYVKPILKQNLENVAIKMNEKHSGTTVSYLDANFPFYDGYPLFPHLSHNDGKKVDIAFFYKDTNGEQLNDAPSFIGYGVYEEPKNREYNTPDDCKEKGYWQYSFLRKIVPQWNKDKIIFDKVRTKNLIDFISKEGSTNKIFIEPHLKSRMKLRSNKIRFHGCQAVRHDDHIHLQIK